MRVYNADVNARSIALFNFEGLSSAEGADLLDRENIALRAGYHCAPLIHGILSNGDRKYDGALRLSVGYFNTKRECDKVLKAVSGITKTLLL